MLPTFSRKLGDSELSYFLPSRADGVNDMYLHLGFRAPQSLVNPHRVALAWAILRMRHPLLSASVVMEPGVYDSARFVYTPPTSPASVLLAAQSTLILKNAPKDVLIDAYLNGPRTLSNECVSALILSSSDSAFSQELGVPGGKTAVITPPQTPRPTAAELNLTPGTQADNNPNKICEFDLLFCAAHFLGDGIALHTSVNELFTLLAGRGSESLPAAPLSHPSGISGVSANSGIAISGNGSVDARSSSGSRYSLGPEAPASGGSLSDSALKALLELEWSKRWGHLASTSLFSNDATPPNADCSPLPLPLESRLPGPSPFEALSPPPPFTFQRVAQDLAFRRAQGRLIGGHTFSRVRASSHHVESGSPGTKEANTAFPTTAPPVALTSTEIPRRQCHTLVRTVAFSRAVTRSVLKRCKEEGVSVAHVLFALCNVAWGRVGGRETGSSWEMPMMMYSALNLRPYLTPAPAPSPSLTPGDASYWFLAVGYFNVVLPTFPLPPNDDEKSTSSNNYSDTAARKTLFHRARLSKRQCTAATKTPLLAPYAQRMARERGDRAKNFARKDDELESQSKEKSKGQTAGLCKMSEGHSSEPTHVLPSPPTTPMGTRASTPPASTTVNDTRNLSTYIPESLSEILPSNKEASTIPLPESPSKPLQETASPAITPSVKPTSTALLGLSLLGNLDTMYTHAAYAPLTLHTLTTGSRQRSGALLLFGYTFAGRLWVSLGWDGVALGGEGRNESQGEGGNSVGRGIVWEGLEDDGNTSQMVNMNKGVREMGVVDCEGEVGGWWREVVSGVGEFFRDE